MEERRKRVIEVSKSLIWKLKNINTSYELQAMGTIINKGKSIKKFGNKLPATHNVRHK